tara:strand:+ start:299 stop:466 length:168 start_codon:yes stop_codon:yes gene_type:complete
METSKSIILHVVAICMAVIGGDYIDPLKLGKSKYEVTEMVTIYEDCRVTRQISQH